MPRYNNPRKTWRYTNEFKGKAVQLSYLDGVQIKKVAELVNNMEIYHPYGTVGQLPWQRLPPYLDFGHTPSQDQLLDLVQGIKTFTEGTDPKSDQIKSIKNAMEYTGCGRIFGFWISRFELRPIDTLQTN